MTLTDHNIIFKAMVGSQSMWQRYVFYIRTPNIFPKSYQQSVNKWLKSLVVSVFFCNFAEKIMEKISNSSWCLECMFYFEDDICAEFPNGIPQDFLSGKKKHISVIDGQVSSAVFEPKEYSEDTIVV